ncbi:winged helix-turn-helix domain-containing protein [uncultured Flavonifractor sp.]|uniref:helix-turn-helix domain-containing protein n=1 Tax=uncultured Flavonifractor sp. TaxID=1193534 RepID=UPI00262E137F|nr:winged helix-turn-helix domain-containing protein [uncultured Flavonifractor sp.]
MSRILDLDQKNQFRILLHPVRQEIVHLLRLTGRPLSANGVARRMNLSPVAAQGHLKKLAELGLVLSEARRDRQGEPVVLYTLDDVEIRLHLGKKDAFQGEREAIAANMVDSVFRGLVNTTYQYPEEELEQHCLLRFGALHLTGEERGELMALVSDYLSKRRILSETRDEHWEYVLMAYRAPDETQR